MENFPGIRPLEQISYIRPLGNNNNNNDNVYKDYVQEKGQFVQILRTYIILKRLSINLLWH